MSSRIFIASSVFAEFDDRPLKLIKDSGLSIIRNETKKRLTQQELIAQAKNAEAVIAGLEIYDTQVLEHLTDLRCISRCGVGVDNIDMVLAQKKGIEVFTTPDVVTGPVVELTLAMILDLLRKVSQHSVLMRQHKWQRIMGQQLAGRTVGVIGLGRIGRKVAEVLSQLGARVIGYDIHPDPAWAQKGNIFLVDLNQVICLSDILTLHLAVDHKNPFVLTNRHFKSMKPEALIINVARGAFVDEAALLQALRNGHLAGAALDVFEQEPYQGPLCDLPNVILTPHVGTFTKQARIDMEIQAAKNVVNFFSKCNLK